VHLMLHPRRDFHNHYRANFYLRLDGFSGERHMVSVNLGLRNTPALNGESTQPPATASLTERVTAQLDQALQKVSVAVMNGVRAGTQLIGRNHNADLEKVKVLQSDLNEAVDKLNAKFGLDLKKVAVTGSLDAKTIELLKGIQSHAMISETGEVYAKDKSGKFVSIDDPSKVYTGTFRGLAADGVAGPRTYAFLDALVRGKKVDFENFQVVTHGLWDVSQVPEGYDPNLAGDNSQESIIPMNIPFDGTAFDRIRRTPRNSKVSVDDVLAAGASTFMKTAGINAWNRKAGSSVHRCLAYVNESYIDAGLNVHLGPSGKSAVDYAMNSGRFREVELSSDPQKRNEQLAKLANVPGLLISMYNDSSYKGHGHAVMTYKLANGQTGFISDFNQGANWDPYRNQASYNVRVAVPIL
jgi:hypothetical protein